MKTPLEVLMTYAPHDGTLDSAWRSRRAVHADKPFLIQGDSTLSWIDFEREANKLASAFVARGIGRGDRVAVVGRNDKAHVLTLFALARLGAIMVPVNPEYGVREMSYALSHAQVQGVIAETAVMETVAHGIADILPRPWVLVLDAGADDSRSLGAAMRDAPEAVPPAAGQADDTCVIIYTSGTTGFPKGVMHSQRNLVTAGEANVARVHLQPTDRAMIILPFFHMNALFYSVGGVLAAGASMIIVPRFSASTFWHTAADKGATVVNIIEAVGTILCARDRSEYRPDHQLRVVYGVRKKSAPVFRHEFGVGHLFSGFGMTEIPGVTCNPYDGPDKEGSMGVVGMHPDPSRPWAVCRVVDDAGHDVPAGEIGELWVKSPIVMQGYFRDAEQTAKAFQDGWLLTGDLVRRDEDGFFFHVSRKKDIIRKRGENIAAAELEMVVGENPAVFESAALAVPSELGEDEILMVVALRPGAQLTAAELAAWCRERLAAIKVPRYVAFVPGLPHTPTHKIAKAVLKQDPEVKRRTVDLHA